MNETKRVELEVWSDIACPWCWVGKRNLEAALQLVDVEVDVRWRAFQLNPDAPPTEPEPSDYVELLAKKYDMSRERAQGFIERMEATGAERGLEFRFDRVRAGNTFDAHRLLAWSAASSTLSDALCDRMFKAYMQEGSAIDDAATLCRLAEEVGLEHDTAATVLASTDYSESVIGDRTRAAALGIRGVPFFLVGSDVGASGAQPPEALAKLLSSS